jgi:hypothetical protein
MSEQKEKLIGFYFIVLALIFGLIMGWLAGNDRGRAEMKHWQDKWWQAHPVVKEVPQPIDDSKLLFWADETGAICREDSSAPSGTGITCLHLQKPQHGECQGWAGIWWGNRPCPVSGKPIYFQSDPVHRQPSRPTGEEK